MSEFKWQYEWNYLFYTMYWPRRRPQEYSKLFEEPDIFEFPYHCSVQFTEMERESTDFDYNDYKILYVKAPRLILF